MKRTGIDSLVVEFPTRRLSVHTVGFHLDIVTGEHPVRLTLW